MKSYEAILLDRSYGFFRYGIIKDSRMTCKVGSALCPDDGELG